MTDCPHCIRLTRELREAREELAEYAVTRQHRLKEAGQTANRYVSRAEEMTIIAPMVDAVPGLSPAEALGLHALASAGSLDSETLRATFSRGEASEIRLVNVHMCRIRQKLKKAGYPNIIKTVWGVGYQMTEEGRRALA